MPAVLVRVLVLENDNEDVHDYEYEYEDEYEDGYEDEWALGLIRGVSREVAF